MSNLLSEVHPEFVVKWSEKNLPLTLDKITYGSNKRVLWKGACGHELLQMNVRIRNLSAKGFMNGEEGRQNE